MASDRDDGASCRVGHHPHPVARRGHGHVVAHRGAGRGARERDEPGGCAAVGPGEVGVDRDLDGGVPVRLVALAGAASGAGVGDDVAAPGPGDRVRVVADPAGCAVVPA